MINVKYFGSTDIPPFEANFQSVDDMMKREPFKPFGQKNQIGPEGKAFQFEKSSHAGMKNLDWQRSGHTGQPNMLAGFDSSGRPTFSEGGASGVDGAVFGVVIDNTAKTVTFLPRAARLHSPGASWTGAVWSVDINVVVSTPGSTTTTYYFGFDPDDESVCGYTVNPADYPFAVKIYTLSAVGGNVVLSRVWNAGDIDVIPMWLEGSV